MVCFATLVIEMGFISSVLAQHLEFYFLSEEYSLRISAGLDVSNANINHLLKKV